jgi:phosphatidylglycerophosphate synthase
VRLRHLWNLAGLLTFVRFGMAVVVPYVVPTRWMLAFYLVALATDVADGVVARRTGTASRAGAAFDAWVDKILHVNIGWSLGVADRIPDWWLLLWFAREIPQALLHPFLMHSFRVGTNEMPRTSLLGRATAILLAITVVTVLLGRDATMLTWITGALGGASAVHYAIRHVPPVVAGGVRRQAAGFRPERRASAPQGADPSAACSSGGAPASDLPGL